MAAVIGIKSVGGAYFRGRRMSGWNEVKLDNGTTLILPEGGFNQALEKTIEAGHDVKRFKERLDEWVKTGKMPPHEVN